MGMTDSKRIEWSLFLLRLGVFIVMAAWTVDKMIAPAHAAGVFQRFYSIGGLGPGILMAPGAHPDNLPLRVKHILRIRRVPDHVLQIVRHRVGKPGDFRSERPLCLLDVQQPLFERHRPHVAQQSWMRQGLI